MFHFEGPKESHQRQHCEAADFGWERGNGLARIDLGLAQIGKPGEAQVLVGLWKFPVSVHLAVLPQGYLLFEPLSLFDPCACANMFHGALKLAI